MKIFVSGATGVLGKTLVPKLVAAGHTVSALSRTPENDDRLRHAGAHPVRGCSRSLLTRSVVNGCSSYQIC